MLNSFIYSRVRQILPFNLTDEQANALHGMVNFITGQEQNKVFLLKGYAGTGKSSLVGGLIKVLNEMKQKMVLLTPTGRAAKIFSAYADLPAYTIHRKIYRQQSLFVNSFSLSENLHRDTLFLVDEASMIANESDVILFGSGCLLDDLIQYVYSAKGCRLLLIGDPAQLPPVGQILSPALDADMLAGYGLNVEEFWLTEVVRQAHCSGILSVASDIRMAINCEEVYDYPRIDCRKKSDVIRLSAEELVETLRTCYENDGPEHTLVVCRSNKSAKIYNQGIRGRILYREEELESGDRLIVVRNNYFWSDQSNPDHFIANGDIVELVRIKHSGEMYGFHFADVTLRFIDYELELDAKILLETLHTDVASLTNEMRRQLYETIYADYALQYRTKKEIYEQMKRDPYLNALQVKYAYALTCHKSQGGQWRNVFVDQGYLTEDMLGEDYYRWLYTAFTRATKKLYLVNFSDECFVLANSSEQKEEEDV